MEFKSGSYQNILLSLMLLLGTGLANAQQLPGTVTPGQIEKRFEKPVEPLSKPGAIVVPTTDGVQAPEGAENVKLTLQNILIKGVKVLEKDTLAKTSKEYINKEITLKDVYELAAKITRLYTDQGYLISRAIIPPQTIENEKITIQVIEGYVDEVVFENLPEDRADIFQYYADKIKQSRPLKKEVLERYLLLANDVAGMQFKTVMKASADNFGATTLTLSATHKPYQAALSLDNRGSESTGPWQLLLEGTANNAFGRLGATTLRYATVPTDLDELQYWQFYHEQMLNPEGLKLSFSLSTSQDEPDGQIYRDLEIESNSNVVELALSYPWIRSREQNLSFNSSLSYRDSETTSNFADLETDDELTVFRLGMLYDQADAWGGGGVSLAALTLNQGLKFLGTDINSEPDEEDFTSLNIQLRRKQVISQQWTGDVRLGALLSSDNLPSAEKFGLGGESSVRGYDPSEWTGDKGVSAQFELAYVPEFETETETDVQFYGFYDMGKVWRKTVSNNLSKTEHAHSAGLGTRIFFPAGVQLNFELANPSDKDSQGDSNDWQLYGRLRVDL